MISTTNVKARRPTIKNISPTTQGGVKKGDESSSHKITAPTSTAEQSYRGTIRPAPESWPYRGTSSPISPVTSRRPQGGDSAPSTSINPEPVNVKQAEVAPVPRGQKRAYGDESTEPAKRAKIEHKAAEQIDEAQETRPCGLTNYRNVCYSNAFLQLLACMPEVAELLIHLGGDTIKVIDQYFLEHEAAIDRGTISRKATKQRTALREMFKEQEEKIFLGGYLGEAMRRMAAVIHKVNAQMREAGAEIPLFKRYAGVNVSQKVRFQLLTYAARIILIPSRCTARAADFAQWTHCPRCQTL